MREFYMMNNDMNPEIEKEDCGLKIFDKIQYIDSETDFSAWC